MNIVFVASEGVPFAKTGGLADVAGALPRAVAELGHKASLFIPCYRKVWEAGQDIVGTGITLKVPVGSTTLLGHVHESRLPDSDVPVYLIDHPHYFDREGLYGHPGHDFEDNCERFVFFQRAVLEAVVALGLKPDVIHCNDWQTGLIPVYLQTLYKNRSGLVDVGTLLTIHNLAYQGLFWHWDMPITGLDWGLFSHHALEFHGKLSFMKAGLVFADLLTTVSPTYAREIQTQQQGAGLDGLLRERSADLRGIVNGIDEKIWCPMHETMLAARYDVNSVVEGKTACKAWLQAHAGLPVRPEVPLFAQIGRLVDQKGWDLLAQVAEGFLNQDVQLVVLGTGDPRYHDLLRSLHERHPGKVWAYLGFSDVLAHQIEAGADVFLMPSLFEPCGLNQLYSLAHGTVPVVHATGGLVDTVVDLTPKTLAEGRATGFAFRESTPAALWRTLDRVLNTWRDQEVWRNLVRAGMSEDWTWHRSAGKYVELYQEVQRRRRPHLAQSLTPHPVLS
ncbi:glycogen synthase GlgA [Paludisphaera rhizosphaerae]|uniref:glycogen synthase GlgA n=1 Tax=Paludisphaera rhizosphaerae TaxID=2711216 RepID=UPI0013E9F2D1|nr:glycogen synthase GlgA [Paludisphaera rhizosphaerae]